MGRSYPDREPLGYRREDARPAPQGHRVRDPADRAGYHLTALDGTISACGTSAARLSQ